MFNNYKEKAKAQFVLGRVYKAVLVLSLVGLAVLGVYELQNRVENEVSNYLYGSLEAQADTVHALKVSGQ